MRASLDTPLRLEDMARIAHLSPFHFERVFSSLTGLSAAAFQAALRLDAAKRALLEGNTSITEVCFALGYDSLGSFTTRFTRAVGLSPAAFRARVSQFEGIDMRDVLHAAAARAAVGQSDNPAIRVVLEHARTDDAIAWFGAFPKGIPDRPPSSGTIAIGNATFGLGPLASGIHHVLAASYPPSPSIADYLVQHQQMRVATSGPMRVGDGEPIAILLQLRKLEMTDPPILLALPLFTLRPQAEEAWTHLRLIPSSRSLRHKESTDRKMHIAFTSIYVTDQDRAKKFYIDMLGFEERVDAPMGDGTRWVTVAPPGEKTEIVFMAKGFPGWSLEAVGQNTRGCLAVDDVFAAHQKWAAKGVEFTDGPRMEFFGGWAMFKDNDGNEWGLHSPVRQVAASAN